MNKEIIIILIIFFILFIRKTKEHWFGSSWYHSAAHAIEHSVIEPTAKFVGDNAIKGICYIPGVKQMSNEMLKKIGESRWKHRFTILNCNSTDKLKRDAGNAATWIFPGKAGKAGKAANAMYKQKVQNCNMLKSNCKRGPRHATNPNATSAQLVHQNYSCNWNEETKRCNCCSSLNCPNGWTKLNNKQCYKNGSNPGKNNTKNCPKEFPYKTNVTKYGNNGLCYNNKESANRGWGAPHSWCAFKPATGQVKSEIRQGEGVYCSSTNEDRCSLGDDTTYPKCSGSSSGNCKNVNNYMLGYEVIRPPSEHVRMC